MEIKRESGQTMVEYMLLLAVVISLIMTFMNSKWIKNLFGDQGSLGKMIKEESEFGYRHAFLRNRPIGTLPTKYDETSHPSYYNGGETRFFGPKDPYR